MRFLFVFCFYWILSLECYSQKAGFIYDENGKTKVDTSLSISLEQLRMWVVVEDEIIQYLTNSELYSDTAIKYGIQGTMKLSFEIDSSARIVGYESILFHNKSINDRIVAALNKFESRTKLAPKNGVYKYFLILKFVLVENEEEYFEEGKIVIKHAYPIVKDSVRYE